MAENYSNLDHPQIKKSLQRLQTLQIETTYIPKTKYSIVLRNLKPIMKCSSVGSSKNIRSSQRNIPSKKPIRLKNFQFKYIQTILN